MGVLADTVTDSGALWLVLLIAGILAVICMIVWLVRR